MQHEGLLQPVDGRHANRTVVAESAVAPRIAQYRSPSSGGISDSDDHGSPPHRPEGRSGSSIAALPRRTSGCRRSGRSPTPDRSYPASRPPLHRARRRRGAARPAAADRVLGQGVDLGDRGGVSLEPDLLAASEGGHRDQPRRRRPARGPARGRRPTRPQSVLAVLGWAAPGAHLGRTCARTCGGEVTRATRADHERHESEHRARRNGGESDH